MASNCSNVHGCGLAIESLRLPERRARAPNLFVTTFRSMRMAPNAMSVPSIKTVNAAFDTMLLLLGISPDDKLLLDES